jgi:hypothetical protein
MMPPALSACLPCPETLGRSMARCATFLPDPQYRESVSQVIADVGGAMKAAGAMATSEQIEEWQGHVRRHALNEIRRLTDPATRLPLGAA